MKYKCAVTKELMFYLEAEPGMVSFLGKKEVDPEGYALFVYTDEVKSSIYAGYILTSVLMILFGAAGYFSGSSFEESILFGLAFALIGFLIGFLAIRQMQGRQSKYVDYPDMDRPANHLRISIMNRMSMAHVKKISPAKWEKIKKFSPDLDDRIYKKFVGDSKVEEERVKIMKLTPKRERLAEKFKKAEKFFWWAVLGGFLFPLFEGYSFLWWSWFSAGMAFLFLSLRGFTERKFGFFEINNVDLYGWSAQVSALVCAFVAVAILIFPGMLGVADALGIDLMTLIFN